MIKVEKWNENKAKPQLIYAREEKRKKKNTQTNRKSRTNRNQQVRCQKQVRIV